MRADLSLFFILDAESWGWGLILLLSDVVVVGLVRLCALFVVGERYLARTVGPSDVCRTFFV